MPYHNALHAADVVQTTFFFVRTGGLAAHVSELVVLSLLVAAVGHDIGHLGVNNKFLRDTAHALAVEYNDFSPLESMHSATTFKFLYEDGLNFVQGIEPEKKAQFRDVVINLILGTDNDKHFEHMATLTQLLDTTGVDMANPDHQNIALISIFHAADVSNPAKAWDAYAFWTKAVVREFYSQGDAEREKGVAVTPMFNREEPIPMQKFQMGFINFIVQPLYKAVNSIAAIDASAPLATLAGNIARWQRVDAGEEADPGW